MSTTKPPTVYSTLNEIVEHYRTLRYELKFVADMLAAHQRSEKVDMDVVLRSVELALSRTLE